MFAYSLYAHIPLIYKVNWLVLVIELTVSVFSLFIGIILPTLTIYDLSLTGRNGEYIYHSKKKKIRKLSFIRMTSHFGYHFLMIILVVFVIIKGGSIVQYFNQSQEVMLDCQYAGDYIWYGDFNDDFQLPNIHVDKARFYTLEGSITEASYYSHETNDTLVCIEQDNTVKKAINYQELKDNEAIILLEEGNIKTDPQQIINSIDEMDLRSLQALKIVYLPSYIAREYLDTQASRGMMNNSFYTFDSTAIIVNQKTYERLIQNNLEGDYHSTIIYTDSEIAKIQIHNLLLNMEQLETKGYRNIANEVFIHSYRLNENWISQFIYTIILFVSFVLILFLMRLLLLYKTRKELALLNIVGMTKRKIYFQYFIQAVLMYVIAGVFVYIYWYVFECEASLILLLSHIKLYIVTTLSIFLLYILCMMLPICSLFKNKVLDLMNERIR